MPFTTYHHSSPLPTCPPFRLQTRGTDDNGHVGNFVETEQAIYVDSNFASFVQIRGVVPLFWEQPGLQVYTCPPSLPPSLTRSLPPSLPPSLPHSLTPSLAPSLPHSLTPSLPLFPFSPKTSGGMIKIKFSRGYMCSAPAFERHFEWCLLHYGPLLCVNLLGTRNQEEMLSNGYREHFLQLSSVRYCLSLTHTHTLSLSLSGILC